VREWLPGAAEAHALTMGFVGLMIDHGFAFNGPDWKFTDSPVQGLYPPNWFMGMWRRWRSSRPWLERVMHFPEEVVDQALKQVPPEWMPGEQDQFEGMLEQLMRRRKRVPDLIGDVRQAKVSTFPKWE
jgi:hypothetical protein